LYILLVFAIAIVKVAIVKIKKANVDFATIIVVLLIYNTIFYLIWAINDYFNIAITIKDLILY